MLQTLVEKCPKKDRLVVMGDFNAEIGVSRQHIYCGKFGVTEGRPNDRGKLP